MGDKDSTKTRVEPLMDYLSWDVKKINQFLALFDRKIMIEDTIKEICYGKKTDGHNGEKQIPAPISLLEWYVNHPEKLAQNENKQDKYGHPSLETIENRSAFFNGNSEKIKEAQDGLLRLGSKKVYTYGKEWYIFEGKTNPDIYIETESSILIGEAKRTESKLTGTVKWYKKRDQLIRHIDSVIDKDKVIYSFFILDNKNYKNLDKHGRDFQYYKESLPHRNSQEINKIMETYIGCITWSDIAKRFPELKSQFKD